MISFEITAKRLDRVANTISINLLRNFIAHPEFIHSFFPQPDDYEQNTLTQLNASQR